MRLAHPLVQLGLTVAAGAALIAVLPSIQVATAAAPAATAPYEQSVTVLAPEVARERVGTGRHGQPIKIGRAHV